MDGLAAFPHSHGFTREERKRECRQPVSEVGWEGALLSVIQQRQTLNQ